MQLFYCPEVLEGNLHLSNEESKHCVKVLRKKEGDLINLIDGQGNFYEVIIKLASQNKTLFKTNTCKKSNKRKRVILFLISSFF